jgi:hypothetical protein
MRRAVPIDMRTYFSCVLLAACASAPPVEPKGGPRGLRATDHLDEARRHDELARQQGRSPLPTAMGPGYRGDLPAMAWSRSWDTTEHGRLAEIHRGKAGELNAELDEACGTRSAADSASPFEQFAIGGWNTATGVILYLSPDAGSPDALLAAMKCHRAAMMIAPMPNMDNCPLDLPGLLLDAHGDAESITISLSVRDEKLVPELQRRAALEIESATAHRSHHGD